MQLDSVVGAGFWLRPASERCMHAENSGRAVTSTANFGRHSLRNSDAQRLLHSKNFRVAHYRWKYLDSDRLRNVTDMHHNMDMRDYLRWKYFGLYMGRLPQT